MPFILKPVEEIKSIEVQPSIEKIENVELDSLSILYLFLVFLFFYIFKSVFFNLLIFVFKILVIGAFAFVTYSLFIS